MYDMCRLACPEIKPFEFSGICHSFKAIKFQKLVDMDQLVTKIDGLDAKIEKMRPKTPKEKLELRTLDSGPYTQKLSDFFQDKEKDMEASGKNEYVLTSDDVEQFSKGQIEDSFNDYEDNEDDTDVM